MRLEKKTTATLLITIFMISILAILAVNATGMGTLNVETGHVKGEVFVDGTSWGTDPLLTFEGTPL